MKPNSARAVCAGLVFLTVASAALGAQEKDKGTSVFVAGVANAETGQPLEGAEVLLVDLHRLATANALGEARLDAVPRGTHTVRVRKLGYAPSEIQLAFSGDTTGAVFRLPRSAVQLGTVNVQAEWVPPKIRDVERRQRRGIGRFLNADALDKERDRDFGVLMSSRFPGLRVVTALDGKQQIVSIRGKPCPLTVFLDDVPFTEGEDIWTIRTWDLAAVEFYRSGETPGEYRSRVRGDCGLLLLWSKWY